jgi:membrane-associated phospholipid phosphatase
MFQNVAAGLHRLTRTGFIATLLCLSCTSQAADVTPSYPEMVINDAKHVLTSPARWEKDDWQDFGIATLAVVATAAVIDQPVRKAMLRHHGSNGYVHEVERFGAEYSLGVLGGFYVAGAVLDDETAVSVAQDGLAASLIASGIVTPALKFAIGRSRPNQNAGRYDFHPFSGSASLPSGHTTQAFAIASVVSAHYDNLLVKIVAYGLASGVGLARTYHDAHFASDVVAGAIIGTLVGHAVVEHNQKLRAGKLALLPMIGPDTVGVRLAGRF